MQTEHELASLALALVSPATKLSVDETRLARPIRPVASRSDIKAARKAIREGLDPLGNAFLTLRSSRVRRSQGATYTPFALVDSMARWSHRESDPVRVVDPGAGSGRFLLAAAEKFPRAQLVGVEMDPLAALLLRANVSVLGHSRRALIQVGDYRNLRLPKVDGPTLFIGNPPYVRHHDISEEWKAWYAQAAARLGFRASKLAGLHLHFFLKTMELAREGDIGVFLTSAEWLDVNYGALLRQLLASAMGGLSLHVLDPRTLPFSDVATTGAITCFRVGTKNASLLVRSVKRVSHLGSLAGGRPVPWRSLAASERWSTIIRPGPPAPRGFVELGEFCRVHRGQVTGNNQIWIAGSHSVNLPSELLTPTVTKARELLNAGSALRSSSGLRCVINLPGELDQLGEKEFEVVQKFLDWARQQGAHNSYIARHRKPWWAVNLRAAAPIICTYMARRPPAFVRNLCGARHINIAHGLYPREPIPESLLDALAAWLGRHVGVEGGRTYAGGLTKYEPRELERVLVPRLENLPI